MPHLRGRVFHVTRLAALAEILRAGEIRGNADRALPTVFGSTNSYFRNRGCISFFDYRSASEAQIEEATGKCSPFRLPPVVEERDHLGTETKIAYLFLSPADHELLIPWTNWKVDEAYSEKIVPYVESGYPGSVPVSSIEEALCVTIEWPTDPIADALRRGRRRCMDGG